MLKRFRDDEDGFTLIELLVVILIIGILAAIALPTFLGQREKAQDSDAKSNARNLVTQIESCYADTQDYTQCNSETALNPSGIPYGTGAGQASVTAAPNANSFTITSVSKSGSSFIITKSNGGAPARSCTGTSKGCNTSWGTVVTS
jgi:type IV pilus assembly protein PilA